MGTSILRLGLLLAMGTLRVTALELGSPFQDHAVLQRGMSLPVWGWAGANEEIVVAFRGQQVITFCDASGYFRAVLPPFPASAEGLPLTVTSASGGRMICKDVLVGEVWICAGQSNMEWALGKLDDPYARKVEADLTERPIRCLDVAHSVALSPQQRCPMRWLTTDQAAEWTGVGAGFAYFLNQHLEGVPIGVVQVSWGSAFIEGFLPIELMAELPHFRERMDRFFADELEETEELMAKPWARDGNSRANIRLRQKPNIIYNGMVHPLLGYALRGVVWYQGEANACHRTSTVATVLAYEDLLKALVQTLRDRSGNPDLFALVVPLPGYKTIYDSPADVTEAEKYEYPGTVSLALMREVQRNIRELPDTAVPVTVDTGDLNNIHPQAKMAICERLALLAAREAYGHDVVASGPAFRGLKMVTSGVKVSFDHAEGMRTLDGAAPKGFWLAGQDHVWYRAQAEIKGESILLTAAEVQKPVAVRYAYSARPVVNLVGATGLPAEPFRTDSWMPTRQ